MENPRMHFRKGTKKDLAQLKALGIESWAQFKNDLTPDYWDQLNTSLQNENTYSELLEKSECVVSENDTGRIVGMAFLVPGGNPTEIYDEKWCYIRFVSVHPDFRGEKLGETLTQKCIEIARKNQERIMALHTSELMNPARHIYEKLGFRILKEIEPRFGVRYWLYTLDLQAFPTPGHHQE